MTPPSDPPDAVGPATPRPATPGPTAGSDRPAPGPDDLEPVDAFAPAPPAGVGDLVPPASAGDLVRWAETLAGIARTGLGFTESQFERERYEEVLAVAADMRTAAETGYEAGALADEWMKSVGAGVSGYVTPKIAIGAVVGNDQGRLLLIQRADSGVWLYPTGWADVGYSPAEVAVKEVYEETGIQAEVVQPLAILDGLRLGFTRIPLYSLVFHCRAVGGSLRPHPLECLDAGWFAEDELPQPLASFDRWGPQAFRAIRGEPISTSFDLPRQPVWRGQDEADGEHGEPTP